MNENLEQAVLMLQRRSRQKFYSSPYYTEITDRALDYLLRNLHLNKHPGYLVRNAIANAKKTIYKRQHICSIGNLQSLSIENIPSRHSRNQAVEEFWAFKDWFERIQWKNRDRFIIKFLLCGKTEHDLAEHWNISVKQARVRICRTKKRIFQLWQTNSNF